METADAMYTQAPVDDEKEIEMETEKYFIEHQNAMCTLQQQPPGYQAMHDAGTDMRQSLKWDATSNHRGISIDDMGQDVDYDESWVRLQFDFTEYLKQMRLTYGQEIAIFDDNDAPKTGAYWANPQIGICIDMNIIDHAWIMKRMSIGVNTQQIFTYQKHNLLLETELKRKNETFVGRTAATVVDTLYPLYTDNITKLRNFGADGDKKRLWMQTYNGQVLKRLSLGPSSLGTANGKCIETFYVPMKWFMEGAMGRVETPLPQKFTMGIEAMAGCCGEVTRWVRMDPPDAEPKNWVNGGNPALAPPDILTTGNGYPIGRNSTTAGNYQDGNGTSWFTYPGKDFFLGEIGKPAIEVSQNPETSKVFTAAGNDHVTPAHVAASQMPLVINGLFNFKIKNPTRKTRQLQEQYYTDSTDETTSFRPDLNRIIPVNPTMAQGTLGTIPFLANGQTGTQALQVDTCDYYRISIIEDSPAAFYQWPSGMTGNTNAPVWARYFDECLQNIWRLGVPRVDLIDRLNWTIVQTTGKDSGLSSNRTGAVELNAQDDWYYGSCDFMANIDIPATTVAGYQAKSDGRLSKLSTPVRAFQPYALVSTQFDSSLKSLNGQAPSKPRCPHMVSFELNISTPLPAPPAGTATTSPISGYKIIISAKTSITVFLYSNGTSRMVASEEQP